MTPLIAGNWKMNAGGAAGLSLVKEVAAQSSDFLGVEVLVCPPMIALTAISAAASGSAVKVGAQDCHMQQKGAHTGDVSAGMIAAAGAHFVIVGHSERRTDHGETSQMVWAKASAAADAGLTPIICVGETKEQRESGQAVDIVLQQVQASVPDGAAARGLVIAYEPVWAIGTGLVATPQDIAEMHGALRTALVTRFGDAGVGVRILYGGSMKPDNAADILAVPDVNGGLIGGASLDAGSFLQIIQAAT